MRLNELQEPTVENKVDDNLFFIAMNEAGNLVYVLKPEPGSSNPELYFVIDLEKKSIYEKCFADAGERMKSGEMKKLRFETKNKSKGSPMLSANDAIKRIGDVVNNLEVKNGLRINHNIKK